VIRSLGCIVLRGFKSSCGQATSYGSVRYSLEPQSGLATTQKWGQPDAMKGVGGLAGVSVNGLLPEEIFNSPQVGALCQTQSLDFTM
jgi:hypothetical protein